MKLERSALYRITPPFTAGSAAGLPVILLCLVSMQAAIGGEALVDPKLTQWLAGLNAASEMSGFVGSLSKDHKQYHPHATKDCILLDPVALQDPNTVFDAKGHAEAMEQDRLSCPICSPPPPPPKTSAPPPPAPATKPPAAAKVPKEKKSKGIPPQAAYKSPHIEEFDAWASGAKKGSPASQYQIGQANAGPVAYTGSRDFNAPFDWKEADRGNEQSEVKSHSEYNDLKAVAKHVGNVSSAAGETLKISIDSETALAKPFAVIDKTITIGEIGVAYSESFSKGTAKLVGEGAKWATTESLLSACPSVGAATGNLFLVPGALVPGGLLGYLAGYGLGAGVCALGAVYVGDGAGNYLEKAVEPPIKKAIETLNQKGTEAIQGVEKGVEGMVWSQGGFMQGLADP